MRTPDQITNLRKVFLWVYGPYVMFLGDEEINLLADKIQTVVNNVGVWTWEIRVLTDIDFEGNWSEIKPEPKSPCCTSITIEKKCKELLNRYPAIISILVKAKENPKLFFQFGS